MAASIRDQCSSFSANVDSIASADVGRMGRRRRVNRGAEVVHDKLRHIGTRQGRISIGPLNVYAVADVNTDRSRYEDIEIATVLPPHRKDPVELYIEETA